ncbi:MAG: hypothetical protein R3C28_22865 [Pirellulaceae bacterium]
MSETTNKTIFSAFAGPFLWNVPIRSGLAKVLGGVLLLAAVAKATSMSGGRLPESSWLAQSWVLALVVLCEVAAATWFWLWAERFWRITRSGGLILFSIFAVISLRSVLNGESCHCFGNWITSPWITLLFDLFAILALSILPATGNRQPATSNRIPDTGYPLPFSY